MKPGAFFVQGAVSRTGLWGAPAYFPIRFMMKLPSLLPTVSMSVYRSLPRPTMRPRSLALQIKSRITRPVIWSGIHATVKPDECLQQTDMVYVGEGEALVVDLADRLREHRAYNDIPGLRLRDDLPMIPAPQRDLSQLPIPDLSYLFAGCRLAWSPEYYQTPSLLTGYWVESISLR